jgi:hypothetical protein
LHDPRSTPSGGKVREGERKREKISVNRGHAGRLQHRTGSARTSLGPILSVVDSTAFCYLDLQIYHNFSSLAYNLQLFYFESCRFYNEKKPKSTTYNL